MAYIEDTLPDLRVTIAEGMEALANATHGGRHPGLVRRRLYRGAETLRWSAAREAPSVEELRAEVARLADALEEAEDNVEDLVDNVRFAASKWGHAQACPGRGDGDSCICDLAERRKAVLDAVA